MARHRIEGLLSWWRRLIHSGIPLPPEVRVAKGLIASIDAGGMPLNPAKINDIARSLGLDVSRKAPTEETIQRIRRAIDRP